mmetsp:Transcript_89691/g.231511  ORF Transcript_89691/g.231511 Transcript_89691/m.231511 type:complete len:273 (+) Transcript_89691:402-1220(+)
MMEAERFSFLCGGGRSAVLCAPRSSDAVWSPTCCPRDSSQPAASASSALPASSGTNGMVGLISAFPSSGSSTNGIVGLISGLCPPGSSTHGMVGLISDFRFSGTSGIKGIVGLISGFRSSGASGTNGIVGLISALRSSGASGTNGIVGLMSARPSDSLVAASAELDSAVLPSRDQRALSPQMLVGLMSSGSCVGTRLASTGPESAAGGASEAMAASPLLGKVSAMVFVSSSSGWALQPSGRGSSAGVSAAAGCDRDASTGSVDGGRRSLALA